MNRFRYALHLVALVAALTITASQAQEPSAASGDERAGEDPESNSQETDVNEDNYRRFMELRDQSRQRPSAPYAVLAPPSNLEKLGQLPEQSQKHLRNQLLGIILDGGRWTPEDAGKQYPFVPSEAAATDAQLRSMEQEAWAELVENYHARESEIHQAGERARSASVPMDGANPGAAGSIDQAGEERRQNGDRSGTSLARPSSAQNAAKNTAASREAGQTVNALDYLTNGASASSKTGASGQSAKAAANPADSMTSDSSESSPQPPDSTANSVSESATTSSDSMAGTSPESAEASASAASDSASAAERSSGTETQDSEPQPEVEYLSEGVIAIRDLKKVKGTGSNDTGQEEDEEDP